MATHSSILVWRIPWTEESGGLHTVHGVTKELDTTEHTCITTRIAGIGHKPISCCIYAVIYWGIYWCVCWCLCVQTDEIFLIQSSVNGCMHAKLLQLCLTLCSLMDYSPPCSSVNRIFQARILEWVAISYSRESFQPRDQTHISFISCIDRCILYHGITWEAQGDEEKSGVN